MAILTGEVCGYNKDCMASPAHQIDVSVDGVPTWRYYLCQEHFDRMPGIRYYDDLAPRNSG